MIETSASGKGPVFQTASNASKNYTSNNVAFYLSDIWFSRYFLLKFWTNLQNYEISYDCFVVELLHIISPVNSRAQDV